ncbi:MAG: hypothetical protein P8X85_07720 [Desulfobacterales bacterium]
MKSTILFPIRYAADQTGLSQHVIRVWERRYGVVKLPCASLISVDPKILSCSKKLNRSGRHSKRWLTSSFAATA